MTINTVGSFFGMNPDIRSNEPDQALADPNCYVGVELELEEVMPLLPYKGYLTDHFWKWHYDNSLRGSSCELITGLEDGQPVKGFDLMVALEALGSVMGKLDGWKKPSLTHRTSTHVHIDVTGLATEEMTRFIILYMMFEDTIFKALAPDRTTNNYCLPLHLTKDLIALIRNNMEVDDANLTGYSLRNVVDGWPKYSAMNLAPIRSIGTIEFRMFNGMYEADKVLQVINVLLSLRNAAKNPKINVTHLPTDVSNRGYDVIFDEVFKEHGDILRDHVEPRDFLKGARHVQELFSSGLYRRSLINNRRNRFDGKFFERYKQENA